MQDLPQQLDNLGNSIGTLLTQALPGYAAGPFLMLCENSVAAWQKNCEDVYRVLTARQKEKQEKPKTVSVSSAESARTQTILFGEAIFLRLVPMQWELFRFFSGRCEQYFGLVGDTMRCQSFSELTQLELDFVSKLIADYNVEYERLFKAYNNC